MTKQEIISSSTWEGVKFTDPHYGSIFPVKIQLPQSNQQIFAIVSQQHSEGRFYLQVPIKSSVLKIDRPYYTLLHTYQKLNQETLHLPTDVQDFIVAAEGLKIPVEAEDLGLHVRYSFSGHDLLTGSESLLINIGMHKDLPTILTGASRKLEPFIKCISTRMNWQIEPIPFNQT